MPPMRNSAGRIRTLTKKATTAIAINQKRMLIESLRSFQRSQMTTMAISNSIVRFTILSQISYSSKKELARKMFIH